MGTLCAVAVWLAQCDRWFFDRAHCSCWRPLCLSARHRAMRAAACRVPRKLAHLLPLWHLFPSWGLFLRPMANNCLPQALGPGTFILSRKSTVERTWALSQRQGSSGVSTIVFIAYVTVAKLCKLLERRFLQLSNRNNTRWWRCGDRDNTRKHLASAWRVVDALQLVAAVIVTIAGRAF